MDESLLNTLFNLFSLFPGQVYCLDSKNIYQRCNLLHAQALGLSSAEEIVGKSNQDFLVFNDNPEAIKIIDANNLEAMKSNKIIIKNEPFIYPDGRSESLSSIKIPLPNAQGINKGVLCIMANSEEIINEYQQLYEQTSQVLNGVISNLPEHVYWKDKSGKYLGCNETQAIDLGFENPSEMIGKTDYDLSSKSQAEAFRKIDMQVMQTGHVIEAEETIIKENKKRIVLSKKAPLRNPNKEIEGIIGISVDITELKSTQEREKKALKAAASANAKVQAQEEIQKAVLTFTGAMSHDLRTPLSTIQVVTTLLDKMMPTLVQAYRESIDTNDDLLLLNEQQLRSLESSCKNIMSATLQADSYIDVTLKIIRGAAAGSELLKPEDLVPCPIEDIIRRVVRAFPEDEDESIKIHYDTNKLFSFMGNSIFMSRILQNLIKNAFEQIELKGKGEVFIWCENTADFNYLKIKDTAGGVSAETLKHIFDGFNSTKTGGTGLGLSSARQIMQAFNGDISCDVVEGDCIEFTLSFPALT